MRVALLTNFIPPYRVSLFRALTSDVGQLRVFVSTEMERGRSWQVEWRDIDVAVQRSFSFQRTWKTADFEEPYELHVAYDTVLQLVRYKPDVIITGELGARSLQALLYGKAAGIPVVLWATLSDRTEQSRNYARRMARRWMIPRFDRVIVNGEAGARYIRRFRSDEPLRVPYTTDLQPFLDLPLENRGTELLFVGALTERKGFHLLLAACRDRGFGLTVVGEGPLAAAVPNVVYAGNVPYQDLPYWFARAGYFIMPSLADEWGVVVNEALAAGVPVIGSVFSQAVDELIEDNVNGWRFEPVTGHDVATAIERACATATDDHISMREKARARALALSPENAAARITELLKSL